MVYLAETTEWTFQNLTLALTAGFKFILNDDTWNYQLTKHDNNHPGCYIIYILIN